MSNEKRLVGAGRLYARAAVEAAVRVWMAAFAAPRRGPTETVAFANTAALRVPPQCGPASAAIDTRAPAMAPALHGPAAHPCGVDAANTHRAALRFQPA